MHRLAFRFIKCANGSITASMTKQCLYTTHNIHNLCRTAATDITFMSQVRSMSSAPKETKRQMLRTGDDSWLSQKMINTRVRLGLTERPRPYYRCRSLILYESIEDVNWQEFFKTFQMPDTFHSWFLVMELHVWMLCVRAKAEGIEGETLAKCAIEFMWDYAQQRAKRLEASSFSSIRESFDILHEEFLGAFLLYDYGLLNSDKALAEAVWSRFLREECDDPEKVELLVRHIRKQVQLLENINRKDFLDRAEVTWLPISDKR